MAMVYEVSRGCTGCGTCVAECPVQAVTMTVAGGARIDAGRCIGCGVCQENCASEAIVAVAPPGPGTGSPSRGIPQREERRPC